LFGLDTEKSRADGHKRKTLAIAAKESATELVPPESTVTAEFPGIEQLERCRRRYGGNHGDRWSASTPTGRISKSG
jgi:hypothetical protein